MHNLKKKSYYFINKFDSNLINKTSKKTVIIFRNYNSENFDENLIIKIKNFCKKKGNKFILSNNIKLAIKLRLDGAYIPSFNKNLDHLSYSLKKKFIIIGSAHNNKEILIKKSQKVQEIFLSSLFKKNKNFLDVNKFKLLANLTKINVVALGGITKSNIKKLKLINCIGFAGISFFE